MPRSSRLSMSTLPNTKTNHQPHSEVPQNEADWPSLEMILGFRDRVRARLVHLYEDIESGKVVLTRKVGRVLFMTLEHEGFHAEVSWTYIASFSCHS